MRISKPTNPGRRSGYALIMIMIFLAVSLTVFASMMYWVSTNAKITNRNNAFNQAVAAAESSTENSLAYMMRDYSFQALNVTAGYYATNATPDQTLWPIQYQFNNVSVSISPTNWQSLSGQYSNLFGLVQNVTNIVTAIATNGPEAVPATVEQDLQFASIPLFQYAIFYNMDLELNPGNVMNINGKVHSNGSIWTSGNNSSQQLTYNNQVDASGTVNLQSKTNDPHFSPERTGNVVFTITVNNPLSHSDSLSMPIGTNNNPAAVLAILQLPPASTVIPSAAAYSPTGQVYFYNEADLIITNSTSNPTNFTVLYNNPNATPQLQTVLPDVPTLISNYNAATHTAFYVTNYINYSFVTNATFYDYREADTVKAIQLNVSNLVVWLTNNVTLLGTNRGGYQYNNLNNSGSSSKGHGINSIYVYNSVIPASGVLPAVRIVNGQQLPPFGFSVATAQPLYVLGNYNIQTNNSGSPSAALLGSTTNGCTVPAGFMADAITILSSAWQDSWNSGTSVGSRNANPTTINAACLEGIVPTTSAGYSGGVENFLRLLETWSSVNLNYNGSIVVLFPSQYATNIWANTTYYYPPVRNWGFDTTFLKGQNYQPPMSPQAKKIIRSVYSAW